MVAISLYVRPSILESRWFSPVVISVFVVCVISYVGMQMQNPTNQFVIPKWVTIYVGIIIGITLSMTLYNYFTGGSGITVGTTTFTNLMSNVPVFKQVLLVLILIVGMAIFKESFVDNLKKMEGWPGFFANLIFALPCLITDLIRVIMNEYNSTHRIVWVLILLECVLMLAYYTVPQAINWVKRRTESGIPIYRDMVYMSSETSIPNTVHSFQTRGIDMPMSDMSRHQLYAISMWIYVSPVDIGNDNTDLYSMFRFGNMGNIENGVPSIHYAGSQAPYDGIQHRGDFWRFHLTNNNNGNKKGILIAVPSQRWNSVVFNYVNNGADIFINGELVHHETFTHDTFPEYSTSIDGESKTNNTSHFILGNSSGSSLGAIQDVIYYPNPLSAWSIRMLSHG